MYSKALAQEIMVYLNNGTLHSSVKNGNTSCDDRTIFKIYYEVRGGEEQNRVKRRGEVGD